jgi:small-conductance mechanosensitive channel
MVNAADPTRRRQLRVMKLKASRLKLKIDPKSCSEFLETSSTEPMLIATSPSSSSTSSAISPSSPPPPKVLTISEQKKQARQIRNRQAAITSRQRYLADTESLRERVLQLEAENRALHEKIAKLQSQESQSQESQSEKLTAPHHSSSLTPVATPRPTAAQPVAAAPHPLAAAALVVLNSDLKLQKLETYCNNYPKEHATFYLRGISPNLTLTSTSQCREINLQ